MEQLLKILEDNARMSVEDIAAMLNKSPAEVAAMIDLARAQGHHQGLQDPRGLGEGRREPGGSRHRAERQPQKEPRL